MRREVEWLRQGVKARTTKSRARINEAHRLIDKLKGAPTGAQRRADIEFSSTQRKTKELIKVEEISQSMGGKQLFSNVSLVLSPGSRLAIVGPNGSGKTTLIRTLLGELEPTHGRIVRAPGLRTAFLDQARRELRDDITLRDFLCPHGDSVLYQGASLHVAAWAARFLFSHHHLATTLLERTGSAVLGLRDGSGIMYGDYEQWESAKRDAEAGSSKKGSSREAEGRSKQAAKLSYKDARELSMIEDLIAQAETKLSTIQHEIDSGLNATNASKLSELCDALTTQQQEVERLYERWQHLENLRTALSR